MVRTSISFYEMCTPFMFLSPDYDSFSAKQLCPPPSSPFHAKADASSMEELQRRRGGVVNAGRLRIDPGLTAADPSSHQGFVPALWCTSCARQLQIPYNHGMHPWSFPCLQQLVDSRYPFISLLSQSLKK